MGRWIPEVRALYERVRRPAITIGLGLAMMVPAAGFLWRGDSASVLGVGVSGASAMTMGEKLAIARLTTGPIEATWRARVADREGQTPAPRYAREYGIPVRLAEQIHGAAVAEGVNPRVAFGLVRTESSFRRTAVSHVGAVGYTQVLPSTARWLVPGTTRSDLFEPRTNLRMGFKYLRYLQQKYDGDLRLALTAYNRGPGTVDRLLSRGRNPENGYADKVLQRRG